MFACSAARGVEAAAACVKALLAGLCGEDVSSLMKQVDVDGWTAWHFAAKSGVLAHVPWLSLLAAQREHQLLPGSQVLEDDFAFGVLVGFLQDAGLPYLTRTAALSPLHLAVWNSREEVVQLLMFHSPVDAIRHADTNDQQLTGLWEGAAKSMLGLSPWQRAVNRNAESLGGFTALDLAIDKRLHETIAVCLRGDCFCRVHSGEMCDELLEWSILRFDSGSVQSLLRRDENGVSTWAFRHALQLVQQVKFRNACTFTFAGYNNQCEQFQYECTVCNRLVCSICASRCHAHADRCTDLTHLRRIGRSETSTHCHCARHSCQAVGLEYKQTNRVRGLL